MNTIERLAAWIFGLAFLGLAGAVATETFMRKAFNRSLQGVDELGGYILAVGASLAFAVALIGRTHIRIDLVHDLLPRPVRIALNILAGILLAVSACAVTYMAWLARADSVLFNATAQTPWATPLHIPQTIWVMALVVFSVVALLHALKLVDLLVSGEFDTLDRHQGPRGAKEELADELADIEARGAGSLAAAPTGERRP